jgi:hypothetical protein
MRAREKKKSHASIDCYIEKVIEEDILEKLTVKHREIESMGRFNKSRAQSMLNVGHTIADNIKKTLENDWANIRERREHNDVFLL